VRIETIYIKSLPGESIGDCFDRFMAKVGNRKILYDTLRVGGLDDELNKPSDITIFDDSDLWYKDYRPTAMAILTGLY
jgi:hypothetical protein